MVEMMVKVTIIFGLFLVVLSSFSALFSEDLYATKAVTERSKTAQFEIPTTQLFVSRKMLWKEDLGVISFTQLLLGWYTWYSEDICLSSNSSAIINIAEVEESNSLRDGRNLEATESPDGLSVLHQGLSAMIYRGYLTVLESNPHALEISSLTLTGSSPGLGISGHSFPAVTGIKLHVLVWITVSGPKGTLSPKGIGISASPNNSLCPGFLSLGSFPVHNLSSIKYVILCLVCVMVIPVFTRRHKRPGLQFEEMSEFPRRMSYTGCFYCMEGLPAVIQPTTASLEAAISAYESQGGVVNIIVEDDDLRLLFPVEQAQTRRDFYKNHSMSKPQRSLWRSEWLRRRTREISREQYDNLIKASSILSLSLGRTSRRKPRLNKLMLGLGMLSNVSLASASPLGPDLLLYGQNDGYGVLPIGSISSGFEPFLPPGSSVPREFKPEAILFASFAATSLTVLHIRLSRSSHGSRPFMIVFVISLLFGLFNAIDIIDLLFRYMFFGINAGLGCTTLYYYLTGGTASRQTNMLGDVSEKTEMLG